MTSLDNVPVPVLQALRAEGPGGAITRMKAIRDIAMLVGNTDDTARAIGAVAYRETLAQLTQSVDGCPVALIGWEVSSNQKDLFIRPSAWKDAAVQAWAMGENCYGEVLVANPTPGGGMTLARDIRNDRPLAHDTFEMFVAKNSSAGLSLFSLGLTQMFLMFMGKMVYWPKDPQDAWENFYIRPASAVGGNPLVKQEKQVLNSCFGYLTKGGSKQLVGAASDEAVIAWLAGHTGNTSTATDYFYGKGVYPGTPIRSLMEK